ncbi:MAG TPA: amidase family protein [Acetobacteraceae bacterium]|nr:amidase family protein [Acetobacteraceae bacterium]
MTEPCDLGAVEARRLIGAKRLSPVELTESCIARIEAVDHAVNAMVARDVDRARVAARASEQAVMRGDELGALHGLPFGVKDLEETGGLRSTFGSPLFRDNVPAQDERSVAGLRAAGGILLGKTNTPEFGAGANTRNAVYGATGNPFDPVRSCAGSSGGSAVALATGMVPLATGSDLGGSLRNPAAFCGIVGFRPSPGVVPSERHGMGWSPLSVNGPMARSVDDLCLMLSAMAATDARDPLAPKQVDHFHPPREIDLSSLRVAFTPDFGFALVERTIREAFAARMALLRSQFAVAAEATPDCTGADDAFAVLRAVGALAAHEEKVRNTPDLVGPNVHANVAEGLRYSAADVARAEVAHTALYRRWQEFYKQFDLIIAPTVAITPRPWRELFPKEIDGVPTRSYYHWLAPVYAVTLSGHPSVSIPAGLDAAGMPFGLQVVGPRGGDAFVLAAAAALQRVLPARPVPDIAKLRAAPPISGMEGFLGFD